MSELYSVHSLVRGFTYKGTTYEEVKVTWFVVGRRTALVPFAAAIQDYAGLDARSRVFPEEYVCELFSRAEAEALKNYLARRPELTTASEPVELPVMANSSGLQRLPRGGGNDVLGLFREKGYSLPFQVEGYFSVRLAEPKVQGDEKSTVIGRRSEPDS